MRKSILLATLLPAFAFAAPHAPSDMQFSGVTHHAVTLHWKDNSNNETGFKIYKDGDFLYQTVANTTSFTVGGLDSGREYKFKVKATDDKKVFPLTPKGSTPEDLKYYEKILSHYSISGNIPEEKIKKAKEVFTKFLREKNYFPHASDITLEPHRTKNIDSNIWRVLFDYDWTEYWQTTRRSTEIFYYITDDTVKFAKNLPLVVLDNATGYDKATLSEADIKAKLAYRTTTNNEATYYSYYDIKDVKHLQDNLYFAIYDHWSPTNNRRYDMLSLVVVKDKKLHNSWFGFDSVSKIISEEGDIKFKNLKIDSNNKTITMDYMKLKSGNVDHGYHRVYSYKNGILTGKERKRLSPSSINESEYTIPYYSLVHKSEKEIKTELNTNPNSTSIKVNHLVDKLYVARYDIVNRGDDLETTFKLVLDNGEQLKTIKVGRHTGTDYFEFQNFNIDTNKKTITIDGIYRDLGEISKGYRTIYSYKDGNLIELAETQLDINTINKNSLSDYYDIVIDGKYSTTYQTSYN